MCERPRPSTPFKVRGHELRVQQHAQLIQLRENIAVVKLRLDDISEGQEMKRLQDLASRLYIDELLFAGSCEELVNIHAQTV
jgi:hypothetical protein